MSVGPEEGSAPDGYREALDAFAIMDRSARGRIRMAGRAPRQMLDGLLTGRVPAAPPDSSGDGGASDS